jgi:DNA-binding CsgD family transcriptional regulator
VAPSLAEGARRALLVGEATDPEGSDAPGLVVLSHDGEIESATPGVERWLRALPDGDPEAGRLPSAVRAVAGQALRTAEHPDQPGEVAVSRVLSRSGTWVVLHGASLVSGGARRVAVIVEPAHPARITPLLMSAYGLTEREQEVTRLVLQGNSTAEIAERLVVSAHTVQQHLKSVFDKTGVRSRRDLVGKVFFAHYEPRLRDNERRVIADQPLRGGPYAPPRDHLTAPGRKRPLPAGLLDQLSCPPAQPCAVGGSHTPKWVMSVVLSSWCATMADARCRRAKPAGPAPSSTSAWPHPGRRPGVAFQGSRVPDPPTDRSAERRCDMGDPDGHLIEVDQATCLAIRGGRGLQAAERCAGRRSRASVTAATSWSSGWGRSFYCCQASIVAAARRSSASGRPRCELVSVRIHVRTGAIDRLPGWRAVRMAL